MKGDSTHASLVDSTDDEEANLSLCFDDMHILQTSVGTQTNDCFVFDYHNNRMDEETKQLSQQIGWTARPILEIYNVVSRASFTPV